MTLPRHRPAASRVRAGYSQPLTVRERHVLFLAGYGFTVEQTANHLDITRRTVETHRKNAYRKLGVRNAVQAANKMKAL